VQQAVEAAGAQQRGVHAVGAVGRPQHHHPPPGLQFFFAQPVMTRARCVSWDWLPACDRQAPSNTTTQFGACDWL
jgi:hypothetical protein